MDEVAGCEAAGVGPVFLFSRNASIVSRNRPTPATCFLPPAFSVLQHHRTTMACRLAFVVVAALSVSAFAYVSVGGRGPGTAKRPARFGPNPFALWPAFYGRCARQPPVSCPPRWQDGRRKGHHAGGGGEEGRHSAARRGANQRRRRAPVRKGARRARPPLNSGPLLCAPPRVCGMRTTGHGRGSGGGAVTPAARVGAFKTLKRAMLLRARTVLPAARAALCAASPAAFQATRSSNGHSKRWRGERGLITRG